MTADLSYPFVPAAEDNAAAQTEEIALLALKSNRPAVFLKEQLALESPACLWLTREHLWLRANWGTYVRIVPAANTPEGAVEALMEAETLLLVACDGEWQQCIAVRHVDELPSLPNALQALVFPKDGDDD